MFFNGVPYELEPGQIVYGGPNLALDKEVLGQSEWEYMIIHFQTELGTEKTFNSPLAHYKLETGYTPHINDMLLRMHHICSNSDNLAYLQAKSLFLNILEALLSAALKRQTEDVNHLPAQVIEYIKSNYMKTLTIPELAKQYGVSSKQLAYLFKKYTGMSPNEYLIEFRVQRAKELLRTTAASVAEISACVGYSDPYYFSKLFKKRTGFPPSRLQNGMTKQTC